MVTDTSDFRGRGSGPESLTSGHSNSTSSVIACFPIKHRVARKRLAERLGEFERERETELREQRRKLERVVNQIDQLVNFIADGHGSASVAEKLRGLEREAEAGRNALATLEREGATVIRLPAPDDLLEIVFDLQKRLLADPASGREELRRIFRDGRITLVPQPGGFYIARSEILPLVLLTPPAPQEDLGGRYTASSYAGAIRPMYHQVSAEIRVFLAA